MHLNFLNSSLNSETKSDRLWAIGFFLFSALYTYLGYQIDEGYFSGEAGPATWVKAVGFISMFLSIGLFFSPSSHKTTWPSHEDIVVKALFIMALVGYAFIIDYVGFLISSWVFTLLIMKLFKGKWIPSSIASLLITLFFLFIFEQLLGMNFAAGYLWS